MMKDLKVDASLGNLVQLSVEQDVKSAHSETKWNT